MKKMKQSIKWTTITKNIDLDTGEEISDRKRKNCYKVINKKKGVIYGTSIRTIINECRSTKQQEIQFGISNSSGNVSDNRTRKGSNNSTGKNNRCKI